MPSIIVMILAGYVGSTYMDRSSYLMGIAAFLVISVIGTIACSYIEMIIKEFVFAPETDDSEHNIFNTAETAVVLAGNERPAPAKYL